MTGLVWLALDGVGHPLDAPPQSPWDTDLPTLRPFVDAGRALDARLGMAGLPQSATGQTAWLTGQNAARVMGGHYGPRPGPTLRRLLEDAVPARLARAGGRAALLNCYPEAYFERASIQPQRNSHGCFPLSFLLAGGALNPASFPLVSPLLGLAFEAPHAPTNDLDDLRRLGEAVGESAARADLLLLDLWFSDFLGHQGGPGAQGELRQAARAYLARLDALLEGVLARAERVVLTSDHGNFEDLRVKTHTVARVPFAGVGVALPRLGRGGRELPPLPQGAQDLVVGAQTIAALLGL